MGVLFGFPNRADVSYLPEQYGGGVRLTPSYSGGSWEAALPLTNLSDRRMHRVARSTNDDAASTTFDLDLKEQGPIGVVAIPSHNISEAGTVRIRAYTGAPTTGLVYDSTALAPWPAGLAMADLVGLNVPVVAVLPSVVTGRYLRIEVVDTANPDGYVQLSRLFVGDAYRPEINWSYGAGMQIRDLSRRAESDGGSSIMTKRRKKREVSGVLDEIPEPEAYARFWKMHKQAGITEQLWFMWDHADTTLRHDRAFLATFTEPSMLRQPNVARYAASFALAEEL